MSHNPQIEDDFYSIAYPSEKLMDQKPDIIKEIINDHENKIRGRFQKVLNRITMPWNWELLLERDPKSMVGNPRYWVRVHVEQDTCARTGDDYSWSGREWMLRDDMTDSEILRTAFLATRGAIEHEFFEMFKIDGQRPFDPHLNLDKLAYFAADPSNTDQP